MPKHNGNTLIFNEFVSDIAAVRHRLDVKQGDLFPRALEITTGHASRLRSSGAHEPNPRYASILARLIDVRLT
ncbi:hypothetical protein [Burkholderia pseudomallei]|uniref:hypothetical protein n=1 Tax=Burkholderia pseudomallei TaxID=28450 RepID=UPI000B201D38|nr:hypothetical protein [Burkholderia pseudomallei]